MSSESEQRLHGEHELQMSKTENSEQNDREIAAFLTKYGDLWLRERDLNPRPPGYEPDELPNCSIPRYKLSMELIYNSISGCPCQEFLQNNFHARPAKKRRSPASSHLVIRRLSQHCRAGSRDIWCPES